MSGEKIIYSMVKVSKTYPPNKTVLRDISLSYFYGAKIGVIGLNGAGKSSLLRIMAGVDSNFNGQAVLSPGYTVGYLPQEPPIDPEKTVMETVREGASEIFALLKEYEEISMKFAEELSDDEMQQVIDRQGELQDKIEAADGWNIDSKLERALMALNCPPPDAKIGPLSGGERRRVALTRLLIQQPDILLLDEPTNHLDAESIGWLENHLQNYPGTVIAVTHDRYFLENVAEWILELDRGYGVPWKGNYSSWLDQKQKKLENEEKAESKRVSTLKRELEWVRMAPKARHAKSKARLTAYEKLAGQDAIERDKSLELYIPSGERLGDVVINFHSVTKRYGDRTLYSDLTFSLPKGAVLGIIGPNGVGKTTLFRMIMGQEQPEEGRVEIGSTVQIACVDQLHDELNPDDDVFTAITGGQDILQVGNREINGRAYVSRFNFSGADQTKKVKDLSGGERNRLHLARVLKQGANVILLDEPTNDIDVNTLRALEEGIENFGGSAIVISHDRWFLDRVTTHTLSFENDGQVIFYEGPYSEFEEFRRKTLGKENEKVRHKTLS